MPRKPKKYHYIYKTINVITNKFYIGMHSTNNLDDGYVGSGKRLWYSLNKHGKENHICEILEYLPDRTALKSREEEIVNKELIGEELCMNLAVGGSGGYDHLNNTEYDNPTHSDKHLRMMRERYKDAWNDPKNRNKWSKQISENLKKAYKEGRRKPLLKPWKPGEFKHTEKTKRHLSEIMKGRYRGGKNPRAKPTIDDNGNLFSTIKECAEFHGVATSTVDRRIKKGIYTLK